MKYEPSKIEKKWQGLWEKEKTYKTPKEGKKFYHLVMFPYPSGDLHIGHWYNFVGADVYARRKKMEGYRVMSPVGFDAFGLPAENAAIKRAIHPEKWTYDNIERMRGQIKAMGPIYDFEKEVITCSPEYYKWTQWMFLKLFENGLAYRKKTSANFCPSCNTVLANEQVVNGECERCGAEVVQKEIEQWLLNIRKYAEELLSSLDDIDWPEKTKTMQRNWIGKSVGAKIEFKIDNSEIKIPVFTTRADTLFGATYLVLAPEHPQVALILEENKEKIKNIKEVEDYIIKTNKKSEKERMSEEKEKTGVVLENIFAVNPVNKEKIPVFIADYVLLHYGTGAIMAVPAHDKRDFDFAKKHNLPIRVVVKSKEEPPYEGEGEMINSEQFSKIKSEEAREKIVEWLKKEGKAEKEVNYKVRDWLVSRQRYWGAPIPIIYCKHCYKGGVEGRDYVVINNENYAIVPVPEKDLPVKLPHIENFNSIEGKSPLYRVESFRKTVCPVCKKEAERETDTLDTFVCSSWYYLRYTDPKNNEEFANKKNIEEWMPVDMYIGGAEHSVLHLLYSRFFTKALRDMGYLSFSEPFQKLRHQGIILGPDGQKMSKSKGNVIDPSKEVEKSGADAVRMYLCFMGPYDQGGVWNPQGTKGVLRFLEKIWNLQEKIAEGKDEETERVLHRTIKKVTKDIEEMRFNTAISAMMVMINKIKKVTKEQLKDIILLLAPFAPHICEEMWNNLGFLGSVSNAKWPKYSEEKLKEEEITLVVQVNGKVRDTIAVSANISDKEAEETARESEKIKKWIDGKKIKKIVVIKNKLVSIVIEE